jgi:3'-phosphoadenosine 5'-phosphosulfate sulfotransferase (PAPS reductase)/FAD synthetase
MFKPPVDKEGKQQTVWSIAKKYKHLPSFRSTRRSKHSEGGSHGKTPECCNILKKKSMKNFLKKLPVEERYDCHFIGTRADESRMRAMSVLQRCRSYVITTLFPYHIRAVTPLSFWTKADIYEYYSRYNIPKNPAYEAHNMERMGCASCPAHKNWEIRLAKDPTSEGLGMLRQNLKLLKEYEPLRLVDSVNVLKKYIKNPKNELSEKSTEKVGSIIKEFE